MSSSREKLEKLLALANDKCNSFESAMAYKMYLKLKATLPEEEAVKKANEKAEKEWNAYDESTWSEDERKEYDYWHGGKFAFERVDEFLHEIFKVEGGYLVRRWNYLNAMSYHFKSQLEAFGEGYEGVRKNCLKQISFFEHLEEDEFGRDEYDEHSQPWYTDNWGKFSIRRFQGSDTLKIGNPKINYLMFIEDDMVQILEPYWGNGAFKKAKCFESNAIAKLEA